MQPRYQPMCKLIARYVSHYEATGSALNIYKTGNRRPHRTRLPAIVDPARKFAIPAGDWSLRRRFFVNRQRRIPCCNLVWSWDLVKNEPYSMSNSKRASTFDTSRKKDDGGLIVTGNSEFPCDIHGRCSLGTDAWSAVAGFMSAENCANGLEMPTLPGAPRQQTWVRLNFIWNESTHLTKLLKRFNSRLKQLSQDFYKFQSRLKWWLVCQELIRFISRYKKKYMTLNRLMIQQRVSRK